MRILTMLSMAVGRLTMCGWYIGSIHHDMIRQMQMAIVIIVSVLSGVPIVMFHFMTHDCTTITNAAGNIMLKGEIPMCLLGERNMVTGVAGLLLNIAMMLTIASVGFWMKMRILTMLGMAVGRLTMCGWYVGRFSVILTIRY